MTNGPGTFDLLILFVISHLPFFIFHLAAN